MEREAIRQFVCRDWSQVAEAKTRSWLDSKRGRSLADVLITGDQLRRYAQSMRPDWPSAAERDADLATHRRVAEALHATGRPR